MKRTPEEIMKRIFRLEWAQFRRGITVGRCKRGRKSAIKDLAVAWCRAYDALHRRVGREGAARVRIKVAHDITVHGCSICKDRANREAVQ